MQSPLTARDTVFRSTPLTFERSSRVFPEFANAVASARHLAVSGMLVTLWIVMYRIAHMCLPKL